MSRFSKYALVVLFLALLTNIPLLAQSLKVGGQLGYGTPKGDMFTIYGEKTSSGGVSLDLDAIYYLEQLEDKLGFGITYNTSFLFGQSNLSDLDLGIYGLSLYGVKINYQIFKSKVTPYVSLSTGLTEFSTPTISDGNDNVLSKSEKSFSFGLRPELGIDLAGFIISAGYIVPMKYGIVDKKAGVFQISLGFRYNTF